MIGGGPAGCAAAATLARDGRPVVLVTAPTAGRAFGIGEGAPPGFDRVVDDVFGPGTFVPVDHVRSLGNRAAWGSRDLLTADFMFDPFGTGWHLDRLAFDARLRDAAQTAGATVVCGRPPPAQTVIDASGRRAVHARRHSARRVVGDRLVAAVTTYARVDDSDDSDATTTVEAAEDGWWYTCPIPGPRRVVAFLTDGDLLGGERRTGAGFDRHARRTDHIAPLLVATGPLAPPLVVAAGTARLEPVYGKGWLAVGDAAASFDPLSSQGVLTAVLMGREAARSLDDPAAFAARYEEIVAAYEAELRATYRREDRWPHAPFWSRRHGT